MVHLLLGTTNGIVTVLNHKTATRGLEGHRVSAVHALDDRTFLAGTYGSGMFRSHDGGERWEPANEGLPAPAIRTIVPDPYTPGAILAGTEPGRIYRSIDGGCSWTELQGIASLPHANAWFLPYAPRAGAVRNIFAPPGTSRLLASVEVGGLLVSEDAGANWSVMPILGDTDIHFVTGHPGDGRLLYAALGWATLSAVEVAPGSPPVGGVARSSDGGATWTKFHTDYTRAVLVPPAAPDLLLAAPAKKVGGHGRIEVSRDNGDSWSLASDGLEMPMDGMVEVFVPAPDGSILAILGGGGLYQAVPGEWRWSPVLPDGANLSVESVAFV